jgi:hypothetical protein
LIHDAERSGHRKIVIASDVLACADRDGIARALRRLDGADVHVIYVLRDLRTLLPAAWQQQALSYPTSRWSEWVNWLTTEEPSASSAWRPYDVQRVLERWRQCGVSHTHLLLYPPSGEPKLLWERFQSIVGWPTRHTIEGHPTHCSLDFTQAEVLRLVRQRVTDVATRLPAVAEDVLVDDGIPGADRTVLPSIPAGTRAWVQAGCKARRSCVADHRNHVVGDPDDLGPAKLAATPAPQEPSDAAMLDAAATIAARLVEEFAARRWQ